MFLFQQNITNLNVQNAPLVCSMTIRGQKDENTGKTSYEITNFESLNKMLASLNSLKNGAVYSDFYLKLNLSPSPEIKFNSYDGNALNFSMWGKDYVVYLKGDLRSPDKTTTNLDIYEVNGPKAIENQQLFHRFELFTNSDFETRLEFRLSKVSTSGNVLGMDKGAEFSPTESDLKRFEDAVGLFRAGKFICLQGTYSEYIDGLVNSKTKSRNERLPQADGFFFLANGDIGVALTNENKQVEIFNLSSLGKIEKYVNATKKTDNTEGYVAGVMLSNGQNGKPDVSYLFVPKGENDASKWAFVGSNDLVSEPVETKRK